MGDDDWTRQELSRLKRAIAEVPSDLEKNERWREVAALVGGGRSKRECHAKYKELVRAKKEKKAARRAAEGDGPGRGAKGERKGRGSDDEGAEADDESRHRAPAKRIQSLRSEIEPAGPYSPIRGGVDAVDYRPQAKGQPDVEELMVEDCDDDFESDFGDTPTNSGAAAAGAVAGAAQQPGTPISTRLVEKLRELCFGHSRGAFPDAWLQQGLYFNGADGPQGLGYGLVQREGGPCGALAAVQAYVLRALLFGEPGARARRWTAPTPAELDAALVDAIATIVWRAGQERACVVPLVGREIVAGGVQRDGVLEKLVLHTLRDRGALEAFLRRHLAAFTRPAGPGVLLFVYAVILSRGVDGVSADMDAAFGETPTLIGPHSYCTQEMVNLFLTGRAVSNVFDGVKVLGDDTGASKDSVRLRGIEERAPVGFLTLFEAYGNMEVGRHYKRPQLPVWVVCSESHYSVLFAPSHDAVAPDAERPELFYYDELARQEEVIRFTLDLDPPEAPPEADEDALIPPLDLVLRTKWRGAAVDWNGVEPLL